MQANTAGANSPYDSSTAAEVDQVVDSFVSAADVPEPVAKEFSELMKGMASKAENAEREATIAQERAREAEARAEQAEEKVEELESELNEERERRSAEIEGCHNRLTSEIEELDEGGGSASTQDGEHCSSEQNPQGEDGESTALEQVCKLPEQTAKSSLSSNQSRARFVAKDIVDYSKRCQAGRTLSSSDIATILKSGTDCKGRTQTVARVMDFLEKLGGGEDKVKIVKSRGTKRVVFDEEYADRLSSIESHHTSRDMSQGVVVS